MRARLALTWCKRPRPIATIRCSTPPMLFDAVPDLRWTGPARFGGWAFLDRYPCPWPGPRRRSQNGAE